MKYLFAIIALLFVLSCDDKTENISDNDETATNTELSDDSVTEEPVEFEQYENKEYFSTSFKIIDEGISPFSDIVFSDTLGNLFYSKKHDETYLKNGTPLKDLLKLDPDGILVWQLPLDIYDINDMSVFDYEFSSVSSSILITGIYVNYELSKMFLAKISADGFTSWIKFWGNDGGGFSNPLSVAVDSKENIYVGGWTSASSNSDGAEKKLFLTKWDSEGSILWTKKSQEQYGDRISGIAIDSNDSVYAIGTENIGAWNNIPGSNMFIKKWDSNGNEIWKIAEYGKKDGDNGIDIGINGDEILAFGHKSVNSENEQGIAPYLIKYTSGGKKIWEKRWRGKDGDESAFAEAIRLTVDNNKIYTILFDWGSFEHGGTSDIMMTVFDDSGIFLLSQTFVSKCQDYPGHISILPEGLVMITGATDGWIGNDLATAECDTEQFKPFAMILEPLDQ